MGEVLSNEIDPLGAARPLAPSGADLRANRGAGNHGNAPAPIVDLPVETWGPAARGDLPAGPCFYRSEEKGTREARYRGWGSMVPDGMSLVLLALIVAGGLGVICHVAGVFG